MSAVLGEVLFVAHRLRYELLVGPPIALFMGVLALALRNWTPMP